MSKETVSMEDFEKEQRRRERKEKLYNAAQKAGQVINQHKDVLAIGITGGIAVGKGIVRAMSKRNHLKKEQNLKENYCYDRSLGHYWKLRRPLDNDEWLEIDRRKKNGERLSDILDELKVLK